MHLYKYGCMLQPLTPTSMVVVQTRGYTSKGPYSIEMIIGSTSGSSASGTMSSSAKILVHRPLWTRCPSHKLHSQLTAASKTWVGVAFIMQSTTKLASAENEFFGNPLNIQPSKITRYVTLCYGIVNSVQRHDHWWCYPATHSTRTSLV